MIASKSPRRVMIVSGGDKLYAYLSGVLPPADFLPLLQVRSAGEAKRALQQTPADILVVDMPLPDESGVELALSMAEESMGVLLVVKSELVDKTACQVEDSGVLTLAKPNSRQAFYSAFRLLAALSARLQRMETQNRTLQEKMADIRVVNRAKWLLIERMHMSERDAHYFIEKRAMDARASRREVAESILQAGDECVINNKG